MTEASVNLISTSRASDSGFKALADLAQAAGDLDYRVIGGHMVQILAHVYPTPNAASRGTADADAGVGELVAAGGELNRRLVERGYRATSGNSYQHGEGEDSINVDLLVPNLSQGGVDLLGGRKFDVAPGLVLAMNSDPILVDIKAHMMDQSVLTFQVPVPSVECAVVMKTLVRRERISPKDITDLTTLLEIAFEHRGAIPWRLKSNAPLIGLRLDTARELHEMANRMSLGRNVVEGSGVNASRLTALILAQVSRP